MGASWWNDRLCQSPVKVSYSRRGCRRESSGTTARPWECLGSPKVRQFCKVYYGAERTSSKPGCNNEKIPNRKFWMF